MASFRDSGAAATAVAGDATPEYNGKRYVLIVLKDLKHLPIKGRAMEELLKILRCADKYGVGVGCGSE